jgi:hypothetical protein
MLRSARVPEAGRVWPLPCVWLVGIKGAIFPRVPDPFYSDKSFQTTAT